MIRERRRLLAIDIVAVDVAAEAGIAAEVKGHKNANRTRRHSHSHFHSPETNPANVQKPKRAKPRKRAT